MPGKKRKADTKMWGSPSTSSSSSRRNKGGSSSRRGAGGGGSSSGAYGASSSMSGINEAKAGKLFDELCEPDNPGAASMEGICKLCEQLELDPLEDIRVLVLLWKLGANKKPAEIQREEWIKGCHKLQLDSIDKFKKFIPQLDTGFILREDFGDFYKFCFQFNRAGTHKTLDKDLVVALLKMCLKGGPGEEGRISSERLDSFCDFLENTTSKDYSKITLDQWKSFLDFSYEYPDANSLKGYDDGMSAWPVLIDEYVEEMEKKK
mmetsp:Transcript_22847/g.39087  ORF Transcript_22847/g.39087 Transcript_22847/m.39087 type:complete len:263 (+) Transcript_22847:49-837(+)